jgi:uncharacterized protein
MQESVKTLINSIELKPGQGTSGTLEPGQIIRIVDVAGQQVCDFSSCSQDDPTEYCDLIYSLFAKEAWKLEVGDRLYTKKMRPIWTIVEDTCGTHEWTGGFCSREFNRFLYNTDRPGCRDILEAELIKLGLSPHILVPSSCLNPFMNMPHLLDGSWPVELPTSKPEDHLDLLAEMAVLWVASVCTMPPPTNSLPLTPIRFEIYEVSA